MHLIVLITASLRTIILAARQHEQRYYAGNVDHCGSLTHHFLHDYPRGVLPDKVGSYDLGYIDAIPVFNHPRTGVQVLALPLDLCTSGQSLHLVSTKNCVVVYHFTSQIGFINILAPQQQEVEIWASVLSEANKADCGFGFGVYGTGKEPSCWNSTVEILSNNYANVVLRDKASGCEPTSQCKEDAYKAACKLTCKVKWKREGRADYAIPILAPMENAYDVQKKAAPGMVHGPGKTRQKNHVAWQRRLHSNAGGCSGQHHQFERRPSRADEETSGMGFLGRS